MVAEAPPSADRAAVRAGAAVPKSEEHTEPRGAESLLQTVIRAAQSGFAAAWQWLRGASGEHVFECYLEHARKEPGTPLTAKQFYLDHLQRKYKRPNRCC